MRAKPSVVFCAEKEGGNFMVITNCYQPLPLGGNRNFCFGVRKTIFVRSVAHTFAEVVGENVPLLQWTEFPKPIG